MLRSCASARTISNPAVTWARTPAYRRPDRCPAGLSNGRVASPPAPTALIGAGIAYVGLRQCDSARAARSEGLSHSSDNDTALFDREVARVEQAGAGRYDVKGRPVGLFRPVVEASIGAEAADLLQPGAHARDRSTLPERHALVLCCPAPFVRRRRLGSAFDPDGQVFARFGQAHPPIRTL